MTLAEWERRFWGRVKLDSTGCLIWQGACNPTNGYPQCRVPPELQLILKLNSSTTQVHRAVYAYVTGTRPKYIDHLCNTRRCVNHHHHEDVSRTENNVRAAMVRMGTYDTDEWTTKADEIWL